MKVLIIEKENEGQMKYEISNCNVTVFTEVIDGRIVTKEPLYNIEYKVTDLLTGKIKFLHSNYFAEKDILDKNQISEDIILIKTGEEVELVYGKTCKTKEIREVTDDNKLQ